MRAPEISRIASCVKQLGRRIGIEEMSSRSHTTTARQYGECVHCGTNKRGEFVSMAAADVWPSSDCSAAEAQVSTRKSNLVRGVHDDDDEGRRFQFLARKKVQRTMLRYPHFRCPYNDSYSHDNCMQSSEKGERVVTRRSATVASWGAAKSWR